MQISKNLAMVNTIQAHYNDLKACDQKAGDLDLRPDHLTLRRSDGSLVETILQRNVNPSTGAINLEVCSRSTRSDGTLSSISDQYFETVGTQVTLCAVKIGLPLEDGGWKFADAHYLAYAKEPWSVTTTVGDEGIAAKDWLQSYFAPDGL